MILAETKRLVIRTWTHEDVNDYAKIISDPAVMRFIGNGKPQSLEVAKLYVKKCIENTDKFGWSRFVVMDKFSKEFMGFCGFADYNSELDFGWRYARRFWGKGYGTEAAKAVLNLGLNNFKFPRIVCISFPDNIGSIKIIEKIGMEFENKIRLNGRILNQYVRLNNKNNSKQSAYTV